MKGSDVPKMGYEGGPGKRFIRCTVRALVVICGNRIMAAAISSPKSSSSVMTSIVICKTKQKEVVYSKGTLN
jgi:hypothetical protein